MKGLRTFLKKMRPDEEVMQRFRSILRESDGFECHPFRVGAYNELADRYFQLHYDPQTLGVVVLNTPSFLETTFRKWLVGQRKPNESMNDVKERFKTEPLNSYFDELFDKVRKELEPFNNDLIHDYDVLPNRRPLVLMTTVGHVAGIAYFYRPKETTQTANSTNGPTKRRMGLSMHNKYGANFAFRCVFIFPDIRVPPDFVDKKPIKMLTDDEAEEAINLFNDHWRDGRFRSVGNPVEKYSDLQTKFFGTPPLDRWPIIASWFEES
ncbi:hypothetical protein AB6A40_003000 [Gnathostoma spinigerum]|uniref:Cyanocobalamin reductase (cyanide-eliminating) n=1 Tax=Gnathostoma spinigerum TaxID=75299 RepID=A0ABD6EAS1_9BILA